MKNTTDKLQTGSRGGAGMTVERFTIIFLLPLEAPRDIYMLNSRTEWAQRALITNGVL